MRAKPSLLYILSDFCTVHGTYYAFNIYFEYKILWYKIKINNKERNILKQTQTKHFDGTLRGQASPEFGASCICWKQKKKKNAIAGTHWVLNKYFSGGKLGKST